MKAALLQFFAATPDGASVHVGHGLEESRIQFDGIFRFGKREFRNGRVKLKLQALQENRVEDAALGALPTQDAVAEDELDALRFAVDAAVKGIKSFKEAHGLARRLFGARPLIAEGRPASQCGNPSRIRRELYR